MSRLRTYRLAALLVIVATPPAVSGAGPAMLSFFSSVVSLDRRDHAELLRAKVVTRRVDATGQDVAVFAAGPLNIDADAYADLVLEVGMLWEGRYVPQVGRFSDPPRLEDLSSLTLDDTDFDDLAACRLSDCGMKLSAAEIHRIRARIEGQPSNWRPAVEREFRQIVLERVRAYRSSGLAALPVYASNTRAQDPQRVLLDLIGGSGPLHDHAPELISYLQQYPRGPVEPEASFIYWARQEFGYKPVVTAFHVAVLRRPAAARGPGVITVSTQLFATHYIDGGFAIGAFEAGESAGDAGRLGYLHRSRIDLPMMWLLRGLVEDRIQDKAGEIFALQLERLSRAAARERLTRRIP